MSEADWHVRAYHHERYVWMNRTLIISWRDWVGLMHGSQPAKAEGR